MKGFYKKIIVFVAPVLLIWLALEVFYQSVENTYTYKAKKVIETYEDTEILIFGDSHSFYGINPKYFSQKTYNLSNVSQSLYFDELLLNKHLDSYKNLKAVVLNISYFTLSQEDDGVEDAWRKYFYEVQMDVDAPSVRDYDPKKYSLALTRRFASSLRLVHEYIEEGTIVGCDELGYGLQDERSIVENKDEMVAGIVKKHENGSLKFDHQLERLQRIIDRCNSRGVELFLIEMPVYKGYYELLRIDKKKKISSNLSELARTNNNTHYFNLVPNDLFVDDDFRDADHLTNEGARKCSVLLSELIAKHVTYN